jgi:acetylornithine deacetylase/succinyl-diaminopimelate desuccinylase-like protein
MLVSGIGQYRLRGYSGAGISHAPQEFTAPGDVANGVEILYRTILLLDMRLGAK